MSEGCHFILHYVDYFVGVSLSFMCQSHIFIRVCTILACAVPSHDTCGCMSIKLTNSTTFSPPVLSLVHQSEGISCIPCGCAHGCFVIILSCLPLVEIISWRARKEIKVTICNKRGRRDLSICSKNTWVLPTYFCSPVHRSWAIMVNESPNFSIQLFHLEGRNGWCVPEYPALHVYT